MPNAAEMFIELVGRVAPEFVPECVKATGRPRKLSIYSRLLENLKNEDPLVRWRVAQALGEIGDSEAISYLIPLLKDEYSLVRDRAAQALGEIGGPKAVLHLIPLLKDEDPLVRARVAQALGEIDDLMAILHLTPLFKDEDSWVRWDAAQALLEIGDPEAIPHLISLLKDEDPEVHWRAVHALGEIGSKFFDEVEKALFAALNKVPDIKDWVVFEALKEMGIRNPEAWVHYKNQSSPFLYSPVTELTRKELKVFKKSRCCYTDNSAEYIRVLDKKTRTLCSIHTLDCDQVNAAYR